IEADKAGYEEAILLDSRGYVCEGTGENLFLVRGGKVYTPGFANDILEGVNRLAAIEILRDQGYEVIERDIARGELYRAEDMFRRRTRPELTPIREVDALPVGDGTRGPITTEIQAIFEDALHGRSERYADWLDKVPARVS